MGVPVPAGCSASNPAPYICPGKAEDDGPSSWVPATHVDLDGVPGGWILALAWARLDC